MIALQITHLKSFMSTLFGGDAFDVFLMEEASITMATTFSIDGKLKKEFAPSEYEYVPWSDMKHTCFQLIKGKRVPLLLKLTFVYNPQDARTLLEESGGKEFVPLLKSLVLNIKYDQKGLLLTTGTSFTTFLMDKTPDLIWDQAFRRFLNNAEIDFEEL